MKTADKCIYPGTFDPVTFGHLDVIKRALNIFDTVVVAIAMDAMKSPLFSIEERISLLNNTLGDSAKRVKVVAFKGLLVDFAKKENVSVVIRGLRAVSDFEYEFQLFSTNRKLSAELETVFLPATDSTHFISSTVIKEVARLGGDVSQFVPKPVEISLKAHFEKQ